MMKFNVKDNYEKLAGGTTSEKSDALKKLEFFIEFIKAASNFRSQPIDNLIFKLLEQELKD